LHLFGSLYNIIQNNLAKRVIYS